MGLLARLNDSVGYLNQERAPCNPQIYNLIETKIGTGDGAVWVYCAPSEPSIRHLLLVNLGKAKHNSIEQKHLDVHEKHCAPSEPSVHHLLVL